MNPEKCKELVIGSIRHHFDGMLEMVAKVGGAKGKAPAAIEGVKSSLIKAASAVNARIYEDYELSAKLINSGVDLAYRSAIVSDVERTDEWIAVLALGLHELDAHTQKVVNSWRDEETLKRDLGNIEGRRLLVFICCAKKTVTVNPLFMIVNKTKDNSFALSPCVFQFPIPQPEGPPAVVGHVELNQERLAHAERLLKVIDSSHAAQLLNDHIRGAHPGTMQ